jgi:hypothetical protein
MDIHELNYARERNLSLNEALALLAAPEDDDPAESHDDAPQGLGRVGVGV